MAEDTTGTQFGTHEELEAALVGLVLAGGRPLFGQVEWLSPDAFLFLRHVWTWSAFRTLYRTGQDIDARATLAVLEERGQAEDVGGIDWLNKVSSTFAPAYMAETYAHAIHRESVRRDIRHAAGQIAEIANAPDLALEDRLSAVQATVDKLNQRGALASVQSTLSAMDAFLDEFGQDAKVRVPLGYASLNTVLGGGARGGRLIYVGARPAMGKSALLLNIALRTAKLGFGVLYVSLEMSVRDNLYRMIANEAQVKFDEVEETHTSGDGPHREAISAAVGRLANLPIVWSTSARTPSELRYAIRQAQTITPIHLVIGDHLNLMRSGDAQTDRNDYARQTYVSRRLKELNIETGLAFMFAVQLSRAVEQRADKRPVMADFRDTGAIEEDADVAAFLYRDIVYNPDAGTDVMEVLIRKNRNGPLGAILLGAELETMTLRELSTRMVQLNPLPPVATSIQESIE